MAHFYGCLDYRFLRSLSTSSTRNTCGFGLDRGKRTLGGGRFRVAGEGLRKPAYLLELKSNRLTSSTSLQQFDSSSLVCMALLSAPAVTAGVLLQFRTQSAHCSVSSEVPIGRRPRGHSAMHSRTQPFPLSQLGPLHYVSRRRESP